MLTVLSLSGQPLGPMAPFYAGTLQHLWVDGNMGNDNNSGTNPSNPLRTIQAASIRVMPGTVVHILPGIYRETITPSSDGTANEPILYTAEDGPGTVIIRGSEPASSLTWSRLGSNSIGLSMGVDPANIYYADLSGWNLKQPPRFLAELNDDGNIISRLMPAREPDWQVKTEWKDTEFWWLADGGSALPDCDPITNANHHCDLPWRSFTQLTDTTIDTQPVGIESGDLTTLGDLTGATLVAMDAQHAHYVYRRLIIKHEVASGRITVDEDCDNDGHPGLGWGSKYYIENHPALLDQPGEWWFDVKTGYLYLWPPNGKDPTGLNLEISRLDNGIDLTNRSYITLDGLTVELFNERAYTIWNENPKHKAFANVLRNSVLRYANQGIVLYQYMNDRTPPSYAIDGFLLENSEIAYMDTSGIDTSFWWPNAPSMDQFNHSGVRNTIFRNNNLHHLGFNSEARSAVGVRIFFPDKLRFENNSVHHTAHAGVQLHLSLIDSTKEYDFSPQEIKLGNILIANNIFDKTCMRASDCGALKFGGSNRPDTHVFRDVLITGNIFRNTIGWSYITILRGTARVGDGNGLYIDYASGIHAYRNIAYNNTGAGFKLSCRWRDGDAVFYNNIAANNYRYGFKLTGGASCDDHQGSLNTQLVNNILINNGGYGIQIESGYDSDNFGNLIIDYNLYFQDNQNNQADNENPADLLLFQGSQKGQYFHNLSEIQVGTHWEAHGVEGDPSFSAYDVPDENRFDDPSPDFHLTASSLNALDRGTTNLPDSLSSLLTEFQIMDTRLGSAFDIGSYETKLEIVTPTPQLAQSSPQTPQPANPAYLPTLAVVSIALIILSRLYHKKASRGKIQVRQVSLHGNSDDQSR